MHAGWAGRQDRLLQGVNRKCCAAVWVPAPMGACIAPLLNRFDGPAMIHRYRFTGSQVLRIQVEPQGKAGVPFLNWRFAPYGSFARRDVDPRLGGLGLYAVCFRGQVILVGSYSGRPQTPADPHAPFFGGDVAKDRWCPLLGALTARSCKFSVSRSVLAEMEQAAPGSELIHGLAGAGVSVHRDEGCRAPESRLRFAIKNWEWFRNASALRLLNRFNFMYAQEDGQHLAMPRHELERRLKVAEATAVAALRPEANGYVNRDGLATPGFDARAALNQLAGILGEQLRAGRMEQPVVNAGRSPVGRDTAVARGRSWPLNDRIPAAEAGAPSASS